MVSWFGQPGNAHRLPDRPHKSFMSFSVIAGAVSDFFPRTARAFLLSIGLGTSTVAREIAG